MPASSYSLVQLLDALAELSQPIVACQLNGDTLQSGSSTEGDVRSCRKRTLWIHGCPISMATFF
eukprot:1158515-Pelagomonas_calceolata.AAC.11